MQRERRRAFRDHKPTSRNLQRPITHAHAREIRDELAGLTANLAELDTHIRYLRETCGAAPEAPTWTGVQGHVQLHWLLVDRVVLLESITDHYRALDWYENICHGIAGRVCAT